MHLEVRDAAIGDADAICDVHVASWRAAYRHIFPPEVLDVDDFVTSRRAIWRAWSHSPTPDRRLLVGLVDGVIAGFAHSGDADPAPGIDPKRDGEVYGFYTAPSTWGSGLATRLMDAAIANVVNAPAGERSRVIVWTLAPAQRARAFYEKLGFRTTGETGVWNRYLDHPVEELEYELEIR